MAGRVVVALLVLLAWELERHARPWQERREGKKGTKRIRYEREAKRGQERRAQGVCAPRLNRKGRVTVYIRGHGNGHVYSRLCN